MLSHGGINVKDMRRFFAILFLVIGVSSMGFSFNLIQTNNAPKYLREAQQYNEKTEKYEREAEQLTKKLIITHVKPTTMQRKKTMGSHVYMRNGLMMRCLMHNSD